MPKWEREGRLGSRILLLHKYRIKTKSRTNHLTLGIQRILALLVLCHFVGLVLPTLLTESPAGFWNVHLVNKPFRTYSVIMGTKPNPTQLKLRYPTRTLKLLANIQH